MNELWKHVSEGNRDAYTKLYVEYYRKLYNYGRKFTDDIPVLEDTIQDTLISIWTRRSQLNTIQNPGTYYYTAFRHALIKKLSEIKIHHVPSNPQFSADAVVMKREADKELKDNMEAAMRMLTSRQREALYLRFYEELSYEEISQLMSISLKATYKIMARALAHLRENFSGPLALCIALKEIIMAVSTLLVFHL